MFDYAVQQQSNFVASKVATGDLNYRRSMILPKFDALEIDLEVRLREILPELFTRFQMTAPQRTAFEKQLTTHNHGGYFKVHNDNGSPGSAGRLLTYIYYFQVTRPRSRVGKSGFMTLRLLITPGWRRTRSWICSPKTTCFFYFQVGSCTRSCQSSARPANLRTGGSHSMAGSGTLLAECLMRACRAHWEVGLR